MSNKQFKNLMKKRSVLRLSVTKALNELETELMKTDQLEISVLEECLHYLENKNESLDTVNKELEFLFKPEDFEAEFLIAEEYSEKVVRCKYRATKKIQELKESVTNERSKNKEPFGLDTSINFRSEQKDSVRIKLPKLSIPKFYGEFKQWLTFWNSFESAIHTNNSLDKIDKFNYLKAHLGGTALNTIEGFSISEETYDMAVKLLKERFARTDILINAHMNNIINMQPLKNSHDIISFRKFYDNINTQIRSLESLGLSCENYGNVLCPILIKILPSDLVLEFNRRESESNSDIKELLSFLSKELNSRERSTLSNSNDDLRSRRHSDLLPTTSRQNIPDSRFKKNKTEYKKSFISASELLSSEINENVNKKLCGFCNSSKHESSVCDFANDLSIEEKKDILLKKGMCFKCLENKGHIARTCKAKVLCHKCHGKHQTIMCFSKFKHDFKDKNNSNSEDNVLTNQTLSETVFLQTLIVRICNKGKEHFIRGIYDSGSQKSYISKFVAEKMGLDKLGEETITHGLFGGSQSTELHNRYTLQLSSIDRKYCCELVAMDQKKICTYIPRANNFELIRDLKEKGIFLSDISSKSKECLHEQNLNEIHLLLGADVAKKLITNRVEHLSCGLVAVKTNLGWTVMGKSTSHDKFDSSLLVLSLHVNEAKITDLWNLDTLGIVDPCEKRSREELQDLALKHFKETVTVDYDGRYKVCLPWLDGHIPLLDNKSLAEKRLKNTIKSLKSIDKFKDYERVFSEWESEGIIERVGEPEASSISNVSYLPHRAVFKEQSTTKCRPVFDGSARTRNSVSINDCIERGPNLIELIPSVLNRFRLGKIGVVADIRKAFLQISLNERDRDYLRFIWWEDGDPRNEIIYRHCRVVFGINCSPFLLAATLDHHLEQAPAHLKDLASKLKNSMYVDNCVASVDSPKELDYFRNESRKLLASAKFDLRGWCNSSYSTDIADKERFPIETLNTKEVPVLGLLWNTEEDTLTCDLRKLEDGDEPVTKRSILSLAHKIFDPIGFTAPLTLIPKVILQECWKIKASWDCKLPDNIVKEFHKWKSQLFELQNIKIPRRLSEFTLHSGSLSLHVFCDACKKSYAACVFLRVKVESDVTCQLVQARSRVAPLRNVSIPRLELLACCIGARLAESVRKDLKLESIETHFWTDSMDTLYWIRTDVPWATFVENRVREIRKLSCPNSWKFVPGIKNIADLPSRGCSAKTLLQSEWWKGPDFLKEPEEKWPKSEILPNIDTVNTEKRKTIVTATNLDESEKFYNKYSSYSKLLRITGWIFRFVENTKIRKNERTIGELNNKELKDAEKIILKCVQKDAFINEKDKRLNSLKTIIDDEGLIRIKTKIFLREDDYNFRLPIVLPSDHIVVKNLIYWKHEQLGHSGVQLLMSALREEFWILKSRKTIRNVIKSCVICKRFYSKPPNIPEGLLPEDRVKDAAIFEIVGVDLAGPLLLKDGQKTWILIVTCAIFRAVHLELLSSLSTENFILGLRRFISRRGRPSVIYSDNGSNFVGTQNLLKSIDWEKLKAESKLTSITWNFIPPSAPWWGGFWERLVGMMKRILRKVLGRTSLNYEEMVTVLCDCESVMNSRPLTYVTDDPEELSPITPMMFLQEIRQVGVADFDILDQEKFKKRLAYRIEICQDLRKRFRTEYLGQLRETSSKNKTSETLKIGDVVVIWNDNLSRVQWPLGRILKIFPSKDGHARTAKLKTKSGIIIRPMKKLCPLEVNKVTAEKLTEQLKEQTPLECPPLQTRAGRHVRAPERFEP